MSGSTKLVTCLVAAALLAGCSGSNDPATAHLFDNVQNLNSGEYDRQIAGKEAEAAAITRSNRAMEANVAVLQGQARQNEATISALSAEIAAARADASAMRLRVGGDPAKAERLSQLENQIVAVESDASSGDATVLRGELTRIRSAIRALGN